MTNNENLVNNILTKPQTFLNYITGKKPIQETLLKTFVKHNCDLVKLNTSNIVNMYGMFRKVISFNQDISQWDTSKVTNMSLIFSGAKAFNQNISQWDTSKVVHMDWMFCKAISLKEAHKPTFITKEQ